MKKLSLYKWFRCVVMFSGIPALALLFASCAKYGVPKDMIMGSVYDKETGNVIPEVQIKDEEGNSLAITDEYGQFQLSTRQCKELIFSKESYQSVDTTLCPTWGVPIMMQKQPEE